ncbi:hypothetical protein ACWDBW_44935 [Streptomyces sp. NPDC001107]
MAYHNATHPGARAALWRRLSDSMAPLVRRMQTSGFLGRPQLRSLAEAYDVRVWVRSASAKNQADKLIVPVRAVCAPAFAHAGQPSN